MFAHRTLFVIGAGASFEFGLPVGSTLAQRISTKLNFTPTYGRSHSSGGNKIITKDILRNFRSNSAEYFEEARRIISGLLLANSIDDFLDLHRDDNIMNIVGKMSIVNSIIESEHSSTLFFDRRSSAGPDFT